VGGRSRVSCMNTSARSPSAWMAPQVATASYKIARIWNAMSGQEVSMFHEDLV
jgi:hypothetical protein